MHRLLFAIFLILSCQSCGKLELDHIPLNKNYFHGKYKFEGTVNAESTDGRISSTFSGETTDKSFTINWICDLSGMPFHGSVKIDENGCEVDSPGINHTSVSTPQSAVGMAAGVSLGSTVLMYGLWSSTKDDIYPNLNVTVTALPHDRIVVHGNRRLGTREKVVIDNGILTRTVEVFTNKDGSDKSKFTTTVKFIGLDR